MTTYTITTKAMSEDGDTRERITFSVPTDGGYVSYVDYAGQRRQICDGLRTHGDTLYATGETLPSVIEHARRAALRRTRPMRATRFFVGVGDRVQAGRGEDHDTGRIVALATHGEAPPHAMLIPHASQDAWVAWDSGVTTWTPRRDLKRL